MGKQQVNSAASGRALWGAALLAVGLLVQGPAARAQQKDVDILIKPGLAAQPGGIGYLALRPNVDQTVNIDVQNRSKSTLQNLEVQLLQRTKDDKAGDVLKSVPIKELAGNGKVAVVFGKPAPEAKPGQPPAVEFIALTGPPAKLLLRVMQGEKELQSLPFDVTILPASSTVATPVLTFKDNTLRCEVTAKGSLGSSPCKVELSLPPERNPALVPGKKAGAYRQLLTDKNRTVVLEAQKLVFDPKAKERKAVVYVAVDDVPRTFIYEIENIDRSEATTAVPLLKAEIRLVGAPYVQPTDKYPVTVEVDNDSERQTIDLLVQEESRTAQAFPADPGARQRQINLAFAGAEGGLLFKPVVKDWTVTLDSTGLYGKDVPLTVKLQEGNATPDQYTLKVTFDDSKPEGVAFATPKNPPPALKEYPKQLRRGASLPVWATGSDPESEIEKVVFFVGKPEDGKMPPKAEKAAGKPLGNGWWTADLRAPTAQKGFLDVGVEFVNKAGLSAVDTIEIELVDPAAPGPGGAAGKTVKGTVTEGGRLQPGLDVVLADDKGAVKGTAKTGTKDKEVGRFEFANVPPGVYTVSSAKIDSKTKGSASVTVPAGKKDPDEVQIDLVR